MGISGRPLGKTPSTMTYGPYDMGVLISWFSSTNLKEHVLIWWTSHNRLGEIRIDSDSIWTPGIIFYNARNGQFSPEFKVKLRLSFKLILKIQSYYWLKNERQSVNQFKCLFWWYGLLDAASFISCNMQYQSKTISLR